MRTTTLLIGILLFAVFPVFALTPTTIGCSATPLQSFGGPVTLTAMVSSTNGVFPTGVVTFSENGNIVGAAGLGQSTIAQVMVSTFSIGFHTVTCAYSGDTNYAASLATTSFTITNGQTTVKITASQNPAPPNTTIVFVVDLSAMGGTPTGGTLTIYDGTTVLFTGPVLYDDGELVFSTKLAPGTHNITATYGGDSMFTGGQTATPLVLVINRYSSQTTLTTDNTQVAFGQPITATVQVASSGNATPTGTVTIVDNGATVGTGTLTGGQAKIMLTALPPGSHSLIANYGGDSNFDVSSSAAVGAMVAPDVLKVVSSASGASTVAPDSLISLFSAALVPKASTGGACQQTPCPTNSGVTIKDSAGMQYTATVIYFGAGQINAIMPSNVASGQATVMVANPGLVAQGQVTIATVAPGIFTADNTPTGVAAAVVETIHSDGSFATQDVFQCTKNVCTAVPFSVGSDGDQVFLILFGTGIRHAQQSVKVRIAGQDLTPAYAGAQSSFPGLDQVNVTLPASLRGAGNTTVAIVIGDQISNQAALEIQ